ncbi:MAG: hypothetical protein JST07_00750 [Bacteroidetes bacterium]|nr:hypothetical protein [Bacteroidota bacterium]
MYKITNFLTLTIVVLFFSVSSNAQIVKLPKALLFGNFTYANPQGDFANYVNNGTGFEVGGGLGLGKTLLYASTGYMNYNNNSSGYEKDLKVIPIKFGIRRYLLLGLFINGAVGLANQSYQKSTIGPGSGVYVNTNENPLLYEIGAGVKLLGIVELGAAYTGYNHNGMNTNQILLKAGVAIKL